jgi:hypothetical protein
MSGAPPSNASRHRDVIDKAHIQHPVRLVEDERVERIRFSVPRSM